MSNQVSNKSWAYESALNVRFLYNLGYSRNCLYALFGMVAKDFWESFFLICRTHHKSRSTLWHWPLPSRVQKQTVRDGPRWPSQLYMSYRVDARMVNTAGWNLHACICKFASCHGYSVTCFVKKTKPISLFQEYDLYHFLSMTIDLQVKRPFCCSFLWP